MPVIAVLSLTVVVPPLVGHCLSLRLVKAAISLLAGEKRRSANASSSVSDSGPGMWSRRHSAWQSRLS